MFLRITRHVIGAFLSILSRAPFPRSSPFLQECGWEPVWPGAVLPSNVSVTYKGFVRLLLGTCPHSTHMLLGPPHVYIVDASLLTFYMVQGTKSDHAQ